MVLEMGESLTEVGARMDASLIVPRCLRKAQHAPVLPAHSPRYSERSKEIAQREERWACAGNQNAEWNGVGPVKVVMSECIGKG